MMGWAAGRSDGYGRLWVLGVVLFAMTASALGQAGAASGAGQEEAAPVKLPVYDVVSIKLNKTGSGSVSINTNGDRYSGTNVPLKGLLQDAYDIKEDLISGVPGPIDSARFDVEAKIVEPDAVVMKKLTGPQRRAMVLPFLVERFQLKAHTEVKILPVYELVVVQGGPKFKPSADDKKHGQHMSIQSNNGSREMTAGGVPMKDLASTLTNQVHRTVIDKTGLAGSYDLAMKWSSDEGTEAETATVPGIFTALQEQLGLKLQPGKGPVETLVVDHVEMPSGN
ncbi:MAG: TIGR03435 family protein [Granulicella sp.]